MSVPTGFTPREFADFRLKVWQALAGWGISGNPDAEKLTDRLVTPWGWETRQQKTDELMVWLLSPWPPRQER